MRPDHERPNGSWILSSSYRAGALLSLGSLLLDLVITWLWGKAIWWGKNLVKNLKSLRLLILSHCSIFLVRCAALLWTALKHSLLLPSHWWKASCMEYSVALITAELSVRCTHMENSPADNYFWICHLASTWFSYCSPYWLHIMLILGSWTHPRSWRVLQLDT